MRIWIPVVLAAGVTSAQVQNSTGAALKKPVPVTLACPAGSQQAGGPGSAFEASLCLRTSPRVFHGPYVAFWPNGVRQSEGQYQDGFRSGRWVFYDDAGVKTGETTFKQGSYDGPRLEYFSNGAVRVEEHWVMGKRQGPQKIIAVDGAVAVTEYRDDRPVADAR